eukprot:m51a1_g9554 hypothetical protein (683) ;mRNA; r:882311-884685
MPEGFLKLVASRDDDDSAANAQDGVPVLAAAFPGARGPAAPTVPTEPVLLHLHTARRHLRAACDLLRGLGADAERRACETARATADEVLATVARRIAELRQREEAEAAARDAQRSAEERKRRALQEEAKARLKKARDDGMEGCSYGGAFGGADPDRTAMAAALAALRAGAKKEGEGAAAVLRGMPQPCSCEPLDCADMTADPLPTEEMLLRKGAGKPGAAARASAAPRAAAAAAAPNPRAGVLVQQAPGMGGTAAFASASEDHSANAADEERDLAPISESVRRDDMRHRPTPAPKRPSGGSGATTPRSPMSPREATEVQSPRVPLSFAPVEVPARPANSVSLLTEELKANAPPPTKVVEISVGLPPTYSESLVLKVPEDTVVLEIIKETLQKALQSRGDEDDGEIGGLKDDPAAYTLCMADDDGAPDTDMPAPDESQKLKDLDCTSFALIDNPEYEAPVDVRVLVSAGGSSEEVVTLPYSAEMTLKQVQREVCKRRRLNPAEYVLVLGTGECAPESCLLRDTATREMRLVKEGTPLPAIADLKTPARSPLPGLDAAMTPRTYSVSRTSGTLAIAPEKALQTASYEVTRVNKLGLRQHRVMTIDCEKITQCALDKRKKRSSSTTKATSKTPLKISEITVGLNNERSFYIRYAGHHTEFECLQATEIVAKLSFLISNGSPKKTT